MTTKIDAVAICGPTSSGKSEIAVLVAEQLGAEIVNADSRQVYRDLPIGTGVPSEELRRRAPHHLFQFVDPCERYSAGTYVEDASAAIAAIAGRGNVPLVVGGTGLYVEALAGTMPMDRAVPDDEVRRRVRAEAAYHPHDVLHRWLHTISPHAGARVTSGDRYRTLRALEAALMDRADRLNQEDSNRTQPAIVRPILRFVVLDAGLQELDARIDRRVRAMFENGLVEEALAVRACCADAPALTGFGYAEALAWHRGETTRADAVALTIARTRRYARRQRTWFRRIRDAVHVDTADAREAAARVANVAREIAAAT